MNSKRTFLGSRRCKDAEQCVGLHDTARPHDLGRHVDHIVAAIWQHIKPIYNLWSTPHSDGGPIPKGLAKHLRSLVAHAGLLSVKLAYDPYTVYTWTKPAYAAGTQGVMKGLKAMSLRYLYVSERASMTQRSSETIAEPWTWPLPVITTEKISNIDGARISNFDLGRTPVSESLAVPNENAKEKRQSKEDQNGTQSDTGIDTTAMIQKKGNAVTSRDSAAPGDIPMEGRNAPTFVGEEQVQEELVGQYRAGELP